MNYQLIKIAKGKGSYSGICSCAAPIGEVITGRVMDFKDETDDINKAYQAASVYNDMRTCGCKVEVKECM